MIPIIYRLRQSIRFENRGSSFLVISEVPLNVVRASKRAVEILQLCDGKRTLQQIARDTEALGEEQVFKICDYFNKRAVLRTALAENESYFPPVTVIIPTRDRAEVLAECLESVFGEDYPSDRMEVIVIDDGSKDETRILVRTRPCRLLTNPESRGQSYCRNLGAQHAKGEILAFLDSDCVAGRLWLRALVSCFQWEKIGAVGGYVDSYLNQSYLDRYEKDFSPLNLGKYILLGTNNRSAFYIPGCSLLVRKEAFFETGGIRETLHLGEDVDFCWRMRNAGWHALYVPSGAVGHRHRNRLAAMLRRRTDYGTSEAVLYRLHPEREKIFPIRPLAAAAFLGMCLAFLLPALLPCIAAAGCFAAEAVPKALRIRRIHAGISVKRAFFSVARVYMSSFYLMAFYLVRFYFLLMLLAGFAIHSLWFLCFLLLLLASSVDYSAKTPQLPFPVFFFYYTLDQISYQIGVFAGCLQARSFRCYLPRFIGHLSDEAL
jgi:mycofactocin system glycosyltransferase